MIENRNRLLVVVGVLSITFLAELFGGLMFGSLSLVSDSVHVLSDLLTLLLSYLALRVALGAQPSDTMNFGYHRLEVFTAVFNGATLLVISGYIFAEAVERYLDPQPVQAGPALIIACIGLAVNLGSAVYLHAGQHSHEDLNVHSAFLHLLGDAGASAAVIIGMAAILWTGWTIVDPIVAGFISVILVTGAIRVLWKGGAILIHRAPVDLEEIRQRIRMLDKIVDIEDLRVWQVCSHLIVGSAHVITTVERLDETSAIDTAIQDLVSSRWNIRRLTLQFETPEMAARHSHDFQHTHHT